MPEIAHRKAPKKWTRIKLKQTEKVPEQDAEVEIEDGAGDASEESEAPLPLHKRNKLIDEQYVQ